MSGAPTALTPQLLGDIRQLIEGARQQASVALNACHTALYWHIGLRIHNQEPGEAPPLGIILCSGHKKSEQIELLEPDASGIHVAEYLTALPSKEMLQAKLHEAIALSRPRLDNRSGDEA